MATSVTLASDEEVPVLVGGTDAAGTSLPLPAGTTISLSVDNPVVATASAASDGSAQFTIVGVTAGTASVGVIASLPDGRSLSGSPPVEVTAPVATALTFEPGAPTPVTPVAPTP